MELKNFENSEKNERELKWIEREKGRLKRERERIGIQMKIAEQGVKKQIFDGSMGISVRIRVYINGF